MLFTTADDVHDSLGRLFQELATDQDVGLRLSRLDTVVQLRYRQPDTKVTLVAREGDAPAVHLGDVPQGTPNPELILTLDADVGHRLWLGHQNVAVGIARGTIQCKGETRRIVDLLDLAPAITPHYEQLLRATGREALLDPEAGLPVEPAEGEGAPEGDATNAAEPNAESEIADGETPGGESTGESVDAAGEAIVEAASNAAEPNAESQLAEGDQPA
ncbi:hypothetical protein [Patulibacter sp.]|uniref:hypothetical protein n=1 Tax=Patulibacter sp. TaxID=1912859 RepID=UPI0027242002|nr:hypothetical protein [Patulibacter sp.]MDO9407618.1 hypothetical protein [Patulibacter sp.]